MFPIFAIGPAIAVIAYLLLQFLLHATQRKTEPCLTESTFPFLDSAIGIAKQRGAYLVNLGYFSTCFVYDTG